jgi:hypothetical protein
MARMNDFQFDLYFQHLPFFWMHLRFLLSFSADQGFLRWRFTRARAKMSTLDALAKRLVPRASKQVCIGYNDWSRQDGIRGHTTGPVKRFVKALEKRATVVPTDEFRSSVTCSSCHKRLKKARLFTKTQSKEAEVDIRTKEQPSKKEVKEIEEMRKFRNPKIASMKIALKCIQNVLSGTNSRCKAAFWNRGQRREEHAGAAEERAKRDARRKQAAGVQAGQPLKQVEQEHVSGKTGSHALQGNIATHVHIAEA